MIVDQKVNKQYVGVYLIDGCVDGPQLATTSRPNGFKRFVTKLVVGWVWVSIQKLKQLQEELKAFKTKLREDAEAMELLLKQEAEAEEQALKEEEEALEELLNKDDDDTLNESESDEIISEEVDVKESPVYGDDGKLDGDTESTEEISK